MQSLSGRGVESPEWNGKLRFRQARKEESESLRSLYEASWGGGITISAAQIEAKIANFPQGQIIASENASGRLVSMINIMLSPFTPGSPLMGGYERVTGGRTFSTSASLETLAARLDAGEEMLAIALCVSIAVHPDFQRNGFAHETLNYAIGFAEANGLIAVPYSAPRGYGAALRADPSLGIMDYLHMTLPSEIPYERYAERLGRLSRAGKAFGGSVPQPTKERYRYYNALPPDRAETTAFGRFLDTDGLRLGSAFGREMTIEDFCLISGRRHIDPTMRMHIENGARFIRNPDGGIGAVFEGSRPEDLAAAGYNVVLSYGYDRLLGHSFAR